MNSKLKQQIVSSGTCLRCEYNNSYQCFAPSSFHGVCFARSGLAICKYCAVVTIQNLVDKRHNSMVEDILLLRLWSKHLCICHELIKLMSYVGNQEREVKDGQGDSLYE